MAELDERMLQDMGVLPRGRSSPADSLMHIALSLGEHLHVSRCFFSEIRSAEGVFIVHRDYCHGLPSLAGVRRLSGFSPDALELLRERRVLVCDDTRTDQRTAHLYERTYGPAGLRARIVVPLTQHDDRMGSLTVSSHEPRTWTTQEVALVEAVAASSRDWFERACSSWLLTPSESDVTALGSGERPIVRDPAERPLSLAPLSSWPRGETLLRPAHDVLKIADEERALERSRIFELSLDMLCILDAEGSIVQANPAFSHVLGYDARELVDLRYAALVHPDDLPATSEELSKLGRGLGTGQFENRCRRPDGCYRWLQWRAAPDGAGYIYASARDITEDLNKTRALAESEQRLRALLEGARDYAIFLLDEGGHVTTWSAGAQALKGYTPEEIIGQHFSVFYTEADRAREHPSNELAIATRLGRYEEEGWRVRKDGTQFWANVVISAMRGDAGRVTGFTKVTRDFSEHHKTRASLQAREASLAASLKEREVLLQEIHHRVKNNLQVIASLIAMQMRQMEDGASRTALEECKTRVQAIALIHEKLYQSRDYASIPFSSYARSLATNVFQMAGTASSRVALVLDIAAVVLTVDKAIPCGLILNELITNALKHAFPGERRGTLRVSLQRSGEGMVSLSVQDDGIGIAGDFDIETVSSLGMQLVSTLVHQLDGQLTITNEAGTTFRVDFPTGARS